MSRLSDIIDGIRLRFSSYQQPVYDPTYVYAPWRKWAIGVTSVLVIVLTTFGVVSTQPDSESDLVAGDHVVSVEDNSQEELVAEEYYRVVKVIDGDTIDVSIDGSTERLRLIGIDTPETVDQRKVVQCFGREASNKAKSMLEGKSVRLESDATQDDRDKYSRLLRYVYLEDGTSFNKYMIAEGYAHEYTYIIPYKYQAEYKTAEKEARENGRGLWSVATCDGDTDNSTTPPTNTPAAPAPSPNVSGGNCDSNYSGGCVPVVNYDLDCPDIGFAVQVVGTDVHRLDRDGDGWGCETYG